MLGIQQYFSSGLSLSSGTGQNRAGVLKCFEIGSSWLWALWQLKINIGLRQAIYSALIMFDRGSQCEQITGQMFFFVFFGPNVFNKKSFIWLESNHLCTVHAWTIAPELVDTHFQAPIRGRCFNLKWLTLRRMAVFIKTLIYLVETVK